MIYEHVRFDVIHISHLWFIYFQFSMKTNCCPGLKIVDCNVSIIYIYLVNEGESVPSSVTFQVNRIKFNLVSITRLKASKQLLDSQETQIDFVAVISFFFYQNCCNKLSHTNIVLNSIFLADRSVVLFCASVYI